ncbi:hypothetical protein yruck0001_10100 [Yersinia ruckeri ATCC 29473]|nr:hypothetical protein yruck0001_10100 [Yersinia ruckeri ATCC 29473]
MRKKREMLAWNKQSIDGVVSARKEPTTETEMTRWQEV